MSTENYLKSIPELTELFDNTDYTDVQTIDGSNDLRHFIVGSLYYFPAWLMFLYKIRSYLVRLFGMHQEKIDTTQITPEDVSFTPNDKCNAFTVTHGRDNEFIAMKIEDKHLMARILIAVEPLENGSNRFHMGTTVHHRHWTGPVYFTIIKPFHYLVVKCMMANGIKR